ncbi:MAG: thioredoxin TrxC [Candidatus Sericytochromatia bacterium]
MFDLGSLLGNSKKDEVVTPNYKLEKVKLRCSSCNKVNSVETSKLDSNPTCGECKTALVIPNEPVKVTKDTFNKEVLEHPGIVLVDFWAPWCGPCRMVGPILEKIAKEKAGEIKVVKIDTDQEGELAYKYQISSIPTLMVFENGKKLNQVSGAMQKAPLLDLTITHKYILKDSSISVN